jgi:hypothetical protein
MFSKWLRKVKVSLGPSPFFSDSTLIPHRLFALGLGHSRCKHHGRVEVPEHISHLPLVESMETYIPSPDKLDDQRQLLTKPHSSVSRQGYRGDWKMRVLVVAIVLGVYFGFVWHLGGYIQAPNSQMFPLPDFAVIYPLYLGLVLSAMTIFSYVTVCTTPAGSPRKFVSSLLPPPQDSEDGLSSSSPSPSPSPSPHLNIIFNPLSHTLTRYFDPFSPTLRIRWCDICHTYKPQRTHHCRVCGVCVLRGDHHCLWTSSCVGLRNHKPFILFLFYLGSVCWLGCAVSLTRMANIVYFEGIRGSLRQIEEIESKSFLSLLQVSVFSSPSISRS